MTPAPVQIVDYDPSWPAHFAALRGELQAALGALPAVVEHVGSTSVPGLAAKPVIDVMVGRPHGGPVAPYVPPLVRLGYEYRGEYGLPGRDYFKRAGPPAVHLHLVEYDGALWRDHVGFRDRLRRQPGTAAAYAALKRELAARHADARHQYTDAKGPFIREVLQRTAMVQPVPRIRAKVVCIFRRPDGAILVNEAWDSVKRERYWGPPGGGVEFHERLADAVRREMQEELGAELCDVEPLGMLENLFTYEGEPRHELVFVYAARFADARRYDAEEVQGDEEGERFVARWKRLEFFGEAGAPLYPSGLYEMLRTS